MHRPCIAAAVALAACASTSDRERAGAVHLQPLEAGRRPTALAAADLDGDGRTDLVATSPWNGSISILASLSGTRYLPAAHQPLGLALVDVNHDGRIDIVVANGEGFLVSVYLGSKDGFAPPTDYWPMPHGGRNHGWGVGMAVADVSQDGHADVAVGAGPWGGLASMLVLGGDGRGGFRVIGPSSSPPSDPDTFIATSMAAGDLDQDGHVDLAIARVGGPPCLRRGHGDGTFARCEEVEGLAPDDTFRSVALADLDLDGRLDLAATGGERDSLAVFLGRPGSAPALRGFLLTNESPSAVLVADVDGDRRLDLLTVSTVEGDLAVARADGKGWFRDAVRVPLCTIWSPLYSPERSDRPLRAVGEAVSERVREGYPQPTFEDALWLAGSVAGPVSVAAGDFDGDGRLDLAVADPPARRIVVHHATSAPEPAARLAGACRSHPLPVPESRTSVDGRVCVFRDAYDRVIVRDRQDGTEAVLNALPSDPVPRGWTSEPDVSGDGRFVLFASSSPLTSDAEAASRVSWPDSGHPNLFVQDRATGMLTLAALDPAVAVQPRSFARKLRVTREGRYVFFLATETTSRREPYPGGVREPCGLALLDRVAGRTVCVVAGKVEEFDVSGEGRLLAWTGPGFDAVVIAEWSPEGRKPRILYEVKREVERLPRPAGEVPAPAKLRKFFNIDMDDAGRTVLLWSPAEGRPRHWDLFVLDVPSRALSLAPYEAAVSAAGGALVEPRFVLDPAGGSIVVSDHPALYRLDLQDGTARAVTQAEVLCGGAAPRAR